MSATKKHNRIAKATVVALMMMLTIGLTSSAVLAGENEPAGSATATNVTPEVTSVEAPGSVNPQAEFSFSCTVRDNNTLADIENVVLKVFLTAATEEADDAVENHYTFKYTAPDTWEEIGPDPAGSHISTGTRPEDLTDQSGGYVFKITLAGVATPGTNTWTAKWIATDDDNAEGSNTDTFSVGEYISLSITTPTLTFSGAPGDTGLQSDPDNTTCTVTSNYTFNIQVKLSGDWIGTEHEGTIPAENTYADKDGTGGYDVILDDIDWKDIWAGEASGENIKRNIFWFLDLPVPLRDDVYTDNFQVQAVTAT